MSSIEKQSTIFLSCLSIALVIACYVCIVALLNTRHKLDISMDEATAIGACYTNDYDSDVSQRMQAFEQWATENGFEEEAAQASSDIQEYKNRQTTICLQNTIEELNKERKK